MFRMKVPPDTLKAVSEAAYTARYKNDVKTAPIYNALKEMPTVPLHKIAWIIQKQYKIQRKPDSLKNIALQCGLPFNDEKA